MRKSPVIPIIAAVAFAGIFAFVRSAASAQAPEKGAAVAERHTPARAEGTTLRAASFNILYAGNKKHPWAERRAAVVAAIRDMDPDVFGVQEAEWSQMLDLLDALPGYAAIGRGRMGGYTGSELTGLFFRRDRFVLVDAETFWLSDTPGTPDSNTWGAAFPRTATVGILIDRTDGAPIGVLNTHFDHMGATAREKSAALLQARLPQYGKGLPWVLLGDFNADPGSKPHQTLVGPGNALGLIDSFAVLHADAPADTSSFHGYAGQPRAGSRIDWVIVTPGIRPLAGAINQHEYGGMLPSDHYPVWADLKK